MDRPFRILLTGVAHDQLALRTALGEDNGETPGVEAFDIDPAALREETPALPEGVDVAVFGSRLEKPLALADRLRRQAPSMQIVFLTPGSDIERFRASLPFVPTLAEAVAIEAEASPDDVAALILESAQAARRREAYRVMQDRINQELTSIAVLSRRRSSGRPSLSEEEIAAVLKRGDEPMLVLDLGGAMLAWNDAAAALFGIMRDDAERAVSDLVDPESRDAFDRLLARARRGETADNVPTTMLSLSGEPIPTELTLAPVRGENSEVAGLAATIRDLSERKIQEALEATMREAQDLDAVSQALTVICDSLDLVAKRVSAGDGHMPEYLETAREATRSAATLAHRLYVFSQRQLAEPSAVDANEIVESMEELIRRTVGDAIEVLIEPTPDLWLVRCNPDQLETALLNLINNARDAMPDGGRLQIRTLNVRYENGPAYGGAPSASQDHVVITVADSGTGMPPEIVKRAFDPFFTTKADGRARGLGLTQVSRFVRQANGDVRIETAPGDGVSVQISLPRHGGFYVEP